MAKKRNSQIPCNIKKGHQGIDPGGHRFVVLNVPINKKLLFVSEVMIYKNIARSCSATSSGASGCWFESSHLDQYLQGATFPWSLFLFVLRSPSGPQTKFLCAIGISETPTSPLQSILLLRPVYGTQLLVALGLCR